MTDNFQTRHQDANRKGLRSWMKNAHRPHSRIRPQAAGGRRSRLARSGPLATTSSALLAVAILFSHPFLPQAAAADVTAGDASTEASASLGNDQATAADKSIPTQDLWGIIRKGGPLMLPIGGCSFLLLAFVFERIVSLRRRRIIPRAFTTRFVEQLRGGELDRDKALILCEQNASPVAEVFAGAVRKWGRPEVEVEQAVIDAGERVTNGLRRNLRVLNGLATVSPLLGMLGTVVGMIRAFNSIATSDALGRPELLAAGIGEALLTTAAGLCVAIPALICYMYFVSRVDKLIIRIDALGQRVVAMVSAEGIEAAKKRSATTKSKQAGKRAAA